MNEGAGDLVKIALAGVFLIIIGTALAETALGSLIPFNIAALGWIILLMAVFGAIAAVVAVVSSVVN